MRAREVVRVKVKVRDRERTKGKKRVNKKEQYRTTGAIDGIVDDNVNTGNSDEDGNGDDNDTGVAMDVDE